MIKRIKKKKEIRNAKWPGPGKLKYTDNNNKKCSRSIN